MSKRMKSLIFMILPVLLLLTFYVVSIKFELSIKVSIFYANKKKFLKKNLFFWGGGLILRNFEAKLGSYG